MSETAFHPSAQDLHLQRRVAVVQELLPYAA